MELKEEILSRAKNKTLQNIAEKILENKRLNSSEGVALYEEAELGWLGILAQHVRQKKNGNYAFYNRNFHIEPTNICLYQCKFCSYKRKENEEGSWEKSFDEIEKSVKNYESGRITEIHIVGGVHPNRDIYYYGEMIKRIKQILPNIHVKAFTAVELDFMIKKAHLSTEEGFKMLKQFGLDSIPGGGAEIFDPEIRQRLCPEKPTGDAWLRIHEAAHKCGIPSNATMLYGHIEKYEHRIDHMLKLRDLQDKTGGFNAFIPLKFRKENNFLSHLGEVTIAEDLRNYAVSRLFLDNFNHIKAYWPMIGRDVTAMSLSFGADDIDGTIDDSTKIYTMAGVNEKNSMTISDMEELVTKAGFVAVERDSLYNIIKS
jgi:aminodeoxyfutalosine synthase